MIAGWIRSNEEPCEWCAVWIGPHEHSVREDGTLGCFMAEYWAGTTGVVGNLLAIIGSNSTSAGMRMSSGTNTVDVSDTVIGNSATVYLDGWYRAAA